jgi:hypothetical protein
MSCNLEVRHIFEQNCEFIAAKSGQKGPISQTVPQPMRDSFQHVIALLMTQAVVDQLNSLLLLRWRKNEVKQG